MPSETHQNFLLLFRNHPELVFELARRAGLPIAATFERSEELTPEFDSPVSARRTVTADLALVGIVADKPQRAVVLEVQLGVDLDKEWTIALYRAGLRQRFRCPAWAIVFSPSAKVRAAFVERMFLLEPELRPVLATPDMVPVPENLDAAIADPATATLAAVMHATSPNAVFSATIAIRALIEVAPREVGRYIQLVSASVGKHVMQQVREQLPRADREELSEWERQGSSFVMGLEEGQQLGLHQGLEQGLAHGLEQGREEALRLALQTVLAARGLVLDASAQARVDACSDPAQLRDLIARATTISTATQLFDR